MEKAKYRVWTAPISKKTGRTIVGGKRTVGIYKDYEKAKLKIDSLYLQERNKTWQSTHWIQKI